MKEDGLRSYGLTIKITILSFFLSVTIGVTNIPKWQKPTSQKKKKRNITKNEFANNWLHTLMYINSLKPMHTHLRCVINIINEIQHIPNMLNYIQPLAN